MTISITSNLQTEIIVGKNKTVTTNKNKNENKKISI